MEVTMQKKNANELLECMISSLLLALEELSSSTSDKDPFCYGEKTAFVECLEWVQQWEHAESHGLNFNVEKRFPL